MREDTGDDCFEEEVCGDSQSMTPVENNTSELARTIPTNGPVRC